MKTDEKKRLDAIGEWYEDFQDNATNPYTVTLSFTKRDRYRSLPKNIIDDVIFKELNKLIYNLSVFLYKKPVVVK